MAATGGDGDPFFDAVRLLLLLDAAVQPVPQDRVRLAPETAVGVLNTQTLLQKLDFWLRYPDYLADELLNEFERSREPVLLEFAGRILESEEPELRAIPMLRYKFGAYEPLDMAMSILATSGLVVVRSTRTETRVREHHYYLTQRGRDTARSAVTDFPQLGWYGQRTKLVVALAQGTGMSGTALRRRQYLQRDYAGTGIGEEFASIADRARLRLDVLKSAVEV
ncbi:hypothetical protein [Micromonospora craniellae]|uniref:hypothetical protein n=1 Tax=Micromonospora craniellae TaxID=2294034 RepID=UPI001CC3DD6C|nr:hypothetical protein [Micromonospora craniellae]